jgi:hypothetical protein
VNCLFWKPPNFSFLEFLKTEVIIEK